MIDFNKDFKDSIYLNLKKSDETNNPAPQAELRCKRHSLKYLRKSRPPSPIKIMVLIIR